MFTFNALYTLCIFGFRKLALEEQLRREAEEFERRRKAEEEASRLLVVSFCWGDEICFVRGNVSVPRCSRLMLMRSSVLELKLKRAHEH